MPMHVHTYTYALIFIYTYIYIYIHIYIHTRYICIQNTSLQYAARVIEFFPCLQPRPLSPFSPSPVSAFSLSPGLSLPLTEYNTKLACSRHESFYVLLARLLPCPVSLTLHPLSLALSPSLSRCLHLSHREYTSYTVSLSHIPRSAPIAESLARPQNPGFREELGWVNVAVLAALLARVNMQNSDSLPKIGRICHYMTRL